jgi:hypothetical protein
MTIVFGEFDGADHEYDRIFCFKDQITALFLLYKSKFKKKN